MIQKSIKWHPYPEEKPNTDKVYLVTLKPCQNTTEANMVTTRLCYKCNIIPSGYVIAWAKIPESYKEEK